MSIIIERFEKIKSIITSAKPIKPVNIIAVSKTFSIDHIQPLLDYGHNHFGENKVQEAIAKWSAVKKLKQDVKLHMIGKLQSNKAKDAVKLFDYIHSLDNQKLADALSKHQNNLGKNLKYFIQVNIGNEIQKSGIPVEELDPFYNYCINEIKLKIIGLMVIPPNDKNSEKYFKSLNQLNKSLALDHLSMGMSADYINAIKYESTFVRIGSSIFGARS
jgi:pyridoxal phosphate enzyme (YggS family)